MSNYIKVDIETNSSEQLEILMAELSETKFYAFEENRNILIAYIKEEDLDEVSLEDILSRRNILKAKKSILPKTNWNKKWESEFNPVIVGDFVGIRAAFHSPIKSVKHEIIITPKMSFGTGHHATTYLMVQEMEKINFKNKSVLDFGTGTGILSILAEKLGAKKITAIDIDDWSIENAKENCKANQCTNINVFKSDNIYDFKTFDIILANINLQVIIANVENFKKISSASTTLLLSGFLKSDEQVFIEKYYSLGFICDALKQKREWICTALSGTNTSYKKINIS